MSVNLEQTKQVLFTIIHNLTEEVVGEKHLHVPLSDLGVDSLMALECAVYLERETGVRLSEGELARLRSMADILEVVQAKAG